MSDPALARLAEAASAWGAPLPPEALEKLAGYLRFVAERNRETNLTADDAWEDLVLKHAADGAYAAAALAAERPGARRVLDLGSGAGFIGVALKLARPELEVTLMEAVERKYRFLNAASERLGLPGLRVLNRRAGAGGPPRSSYERGFDVVVERALAPLPEALALAVPLLAPGGLFAAFQTRAPDPAEPALARALAATGARVLKSLAYRRPGEAGDRRLTLFAAP